MSPTVRIVHPTLQNEVSGQSGDEWHVRCVCSIINRGVSDANSVMTTEIEKLHSLLTVIRMKAAMRLEGASIQVRLGWKNKIDLPNLDVEKRTNSVFVMVNSCYKLRDVFKSLWNRKEYREKPWPPTLSRQDLRMLKSTIDVMEWREVFSAVEGHQEYCTLSMQPSIFDSLVFRDSPDTF